MIISIAASFLAVAKENQNAIQSMFYLICINLFVDYYNVKLIMTLYRAVWYHIFPSSIRILQHLSVNLFI
jgi:hypothetical protein